MARVCAAVLALVLMAVALWRGVRDDWDEERGMIGQQTGASALPDR